MLQAHSFLWHYLWLAPNILLVALGFFLIRRRLVSRFPVFVAFAFVASSLQITTYLADVSPSVAAPDFWRIFCVALLIEGLINILLIGEIFGHVFGSYVSIVRLGRSMIRAIGAALLLGAVAAAAYAPRDNPNLLISGAHLLEQTTYIVECGLLLFIFLFAAHFKLAWDSRSFGIALGLGVSACVHLATWAVIANGGMFDRRHLLDFLNMATYHLCVLVWIYYLLIHRELRTKPTILPPKNNLEVWNRELERLLQQ